MVRTKEIIFPARPDTAAASGMSCVLGVRGYLGPSWNRGNTGSRIDSVIVRLVRAMPVIPKHMLVQAPWGARSPSTTSAQPIYCGDALWADGSQVGQVPDKLRRMSGGPRDRTSILWGSRTRPPAMTWAFMRLARTG